MAGRLVVRQEMARQDVMAGEILNIRLDVTNVSAEQVTGLLLSDRLDAALRPLVVRATQGSATVQGMVVYIDVGTLEAGQTVLAFIEARVDLTAQNGQIVLNQVTADFDGGTVVAEAAAAGLPPIELPATGRDGRAP